MANKHSVVTETKLAVLAAAAVEATERHANAQAAMNAAEPNTPLYDAMEAEVQRFNVLKLLSENDLLLTAIRENQAIGRYDFCEKYQAQLQSNLLYLASIADSANPPGS